MVNDVCGFADPEMPRVCAEYDAAVSKMASPPDLERPGAITDVDGIYDALSRNGFTDKTLVDPAFGGWSAAKTLADDRETFDRLREFRGFGRPILVSINRKNFLKDVVDRDTDGALPASLAATAMAVERGAHVVRTHDVAETRDAALIGHEFTPDRLRDPAVGLEELDVNTDAEFRRHCDRVTDDCGPADDGTAVTAVVELDVPTDDADHARSAAERAGIDVYGDETLLLVGRARQFRAIEGATNDPPDPVERALQRLSDGFE
jgi:dihydropteroate synthase